MRPGMTGSLLSVALCALIAVLLIKLTVTVLGTLSPEQETVSAVPEVLAGEDKPKAEQPKTEILPKGESYAYAQTEKPAKSKMSGAAAADSLSALQQKEIEIKKKEEQLKEKEERLAKIEKEVEQKVKELLVLQKEIQSAQSEKKETLNTKVKSLSKIYGTMKPKEAAKLMENLDEKLVMGIIATMTPDEAAAILALMDVKKAAKISEALSGR